MGDDAAPAKEPPASGRVGALRSLALALPLGLVGYGAVDQRWVSDDGFINVRVVQNVLAGHGPVFNPGERVEATTSPLWTLTLTLLGALGLPLGPASAWAGIALGLAGFVFALRGALALHGEGRPLREVARSRWVLPLGALVFAAVPAVWDFLSAGLENGLTYAWAGATFALLAELARTADAAPTETLSRRRLAPAAVVLGLGPLVRPDLTLVAALLASALLALAARGRGRKGGALAALATLALASALPLAGQLFRMGYYANMSPNTAHAKEAFFAHWPQGFLYLQNFLGTYHLTFPAGLLVALGLLHLRRALGEGRRMVSWVAVATGASGLLHAAYITRVGGDFMHGRMLLPGAFLALLPCWAAPLEPAAPSAERRALHTTVGALVGLWALVCASSLRMTEANQGHIGDERNWYVKHARFRWPLTAQDYARHYFTREALSLRAAAESQCPGGRLPGPGESPAACQRALLVDQREFGRVAPELDRYPLDTATVDPGVVLVGSRIAIGLVGVLVGPRVHLVDRYGLADPVASRFALRMRGRPGHEKLLMNPWLVARYTEPLPGEDTAVAAARHALGCGALAELQRAVREPLTWSRFWQNVWLSQPFSLLRIPTSPWHAEQLFCALPTRQYGARGGPGGTAYQVACPAGQVAAALWVALTPAEPQTVTRMGVECRGLVPDVSSPGYTSEYAVQYVGGTAPAQEVRLSCGPGELLVGLTGASGALIDRVGILCAPGTMEGGREPRWRGPHAGGAHGGAGGYPWELPCPEGSVLTGLGGRGGELIDAVGPVCSPTRDVKAR
jgi:arabinofuranosyltransferase